MGKEVYRMPGESGNPQAMIAVVAGRVLRFFRMDDHMTEVVLGATVAFSLKVLAFALGFGFNVLLARLLGAEGAGIYYLALNAVTVSMTVSVLGLDTALLRFVAANATMEDWVKVAGVYRKGIRIATGTSIVVTVLVIIFAPWIAQFVFSEPNLGQPLRLMALAIPPLTLIFLYAEAIKGLKRIRDSMLINGVGIPLVALPLLAILGRSLGVAGAVMAYVLSAVIVVLMGVLLWRRAVPAIRGLTGHFSTRLLICTGLPLFWLSLMNVLMRMTDTTMLGIWMDSTAVGVYGVAKRTAALTGFILVAVNSIVAPKFAALYAQGDHHALDALARHSARLMTVLAVLLLAPLIVFPNAVLEIFGRDFAGGATVLRILALGQFANVAAGSVGYLLLMSGHEKVQRNNVIFVTGLNALLNVILIPKYGMVGAAVATSTSLALKNLIAVFLVGRHLSIRIWTMS